jgi:hypothetical protein
MIPDLNYCPADEEKYTSEQPSDVNFLAKIFSTHDQTIPIKPTIKPISIKPTIKPIPIKTTIEPISIQPTIEPIPICIQLFTVII